MAALRRISLVDCFVNEEAPAALRALLALSALTSLTAWSAADEFDGALRAEMRAHAPREAWPALQELSLRLAEPWVAPAEAVSWAAKLLALNKLALSLPPDGWAGYEHDYEVDYISEDDEWYDDEDYEDYGDDDGDDFDFMKVCRRIAARAGVALSWLRSYNGDE